MRRGIHNAGEAAVGSPNGWGFRPRPRPIQQVARTIADLEGRETKAREHLSEAIQYRGLDRWL